MIIGICGATASGKTTFTAKVLSRVGEANLAHLSHDSYYRDQGDTPPKERGRRNYDHPDALDDDLFVAHLGALSGGRAVDQPVYDFAGHARRAEARRVEPRPVVLVDGILILASPAIRPLLDVKIFIDTADDLRLLRRLQRDVRERGRSLELVIEQYLDTVRPMHKQFVEASKQHADIIIPGDSGTDVGVDLVVAWIRAAIAEAGRGPA